ncbi:MAG: response regulator [Candidatus Magnetominusculus sp. LBB02]|nr:response regulator [Candidatus Magnetominusculus sp. LBB02]
MRILIVEDDPDDSSFMTSSLERYGQCDLALNGADAVEAFKLAYDEGRPYDLICMDIMLPKMGGIEALKAIRAMEMTFGIRPGDEVNVVMTTGVDSPKEILESYYKGCCLKYMVKPVNAQDLIEIIKQYGLID